MRTLTAFEITHLKKNGCRAENWRQIEVGANFSATKIFNVTFHGNCQLDEFSTADSGLENSSLTNCKIGKNANVRSANIRNYQLGENAQVVATNLDFSSAVASGVGEKIMVMREAGGLEVFLHPELTAPLAWLQAFAGYDNTRREHWQKMSMPNIAKNQHGKIGVGAKIFSVGIIENTQIGADAQIVGAAKISNSTIDGKIGAGAVVQDSVVAAGGYVGDHCRIEKCFVADSAFLADGFRANDSLFFANCDCRRGEACALFAAPFTVSHHQPTLLISTLTSFFNAGSGTNFSNHRYKLGAWHFGVIERGGKCGSNAYLMLPMRVGIFSTILGEHHDTFDASQFPFSKIKHLADESILLPGANLFSAGLQRDEKKWRDRDRRRDKNKNPYHSAVFSPLSAQQINSALSRLTNHRVAPLGLKIPAPYRTKARARYRLALDCYYGEIITQQSAENLHRAFATAKTSPAPIDDHWLDMGGIYAPRMEVERLVNYFDTGRFADLAQVNAAITELYQRYTELELAWVMKKLLTDNPRCATSGALLRTVEKKFRVAVEQRNKFLQRDTDKEFSAAMRINYDLFNRGKHDENFSFVC